MYKSVQEPGNTALTRRCNQHCPKLYKHCVNVLFVLSLALTISTIVNIYLVGFKPEIWITSTPTNRTIQYISTINQTPLFITASNAVYLLYVIYLMLGLVLLIVSCRNDMSKLLKMFMQASEELFILISIIGFATTSKAAVSVNSNILSISSIVLVIMVCLFLVTPLIIYLLYRLAHGYYMNMRPNALLNSQEV